MELSNFYDLSYSDLSDFISSNFSLEKKKTSMRTNQIWKFVYKKGLKETSKFSNISSELKDNIEKNFNFNRTNIAEKKISKDMDVSKVIYLTKEHRDKTPEGEVLDELRLNKICCRRHMLTHVNIE